MKILAFETATYFGGVAYVEGDIRESIGPFAPRESSREVLAAANSLLTTHNVKPEQLDLVAVATGPGLFTGVRVGLSIAKTLVWSGKAGEGPALVGVPTLDAVASLAAHANRIPPGDIVLAVTDARRGEIYACAFTITSHSQDSRTGSALARLGEDIVVRPDRLRERISAYRSLESNDPSRYWIIGDGYDRYKEQIDAQFPGARIIAHDTENLSIQVAALGREMFEASGGQPPSKVQPHYVRRPDARLPVQSFLSAKSKTAVLPVDKSSRAIPDPERPIQ